MVNHYKVLGVQQSASIEEIKLAYHKLSKKLHPDVNAGDSFFTEKFKELQEAYEQLTNSFKRKRHDEELQAYSDYLRNPYRDTPTDFEPEPEPEPEPPRRENIRKETPKPKAEKEMSAGSALFSLVMIIGVVFAAYKFISKALAHEDKPVTTTEQYATDGNSQTGIAIPAQTAVTPDTSTIITPSELKAPAKAASVKPKNDETTETEDENQIQLDTYEGYFTIGSSKKKVLQVQGTPTGRRDNYSGGEEWSYELSTIEFGGGRVVSYSDYSNNLKVKMINDAEVEKGSDAHFTIGSSKKKVLQVQGTPTGRRDNYSGGEEWSYELSTIEFRGGRVVSYSDYSNNLKVKM